MIWKMYFPFWASHRFFQSRFDWFQLEREGFYQETASSDSAGSVHEEVLAYQGEPGVRFSRTASINRYLDAKEGLSVRLPYRYYHQTHR